MIFDLQKAGMGKRISAFLFDIIMFACIAVGMFWALSAVSNYNSYSEELKTYEEEYAKEYNIDLKISEKDFEALSDEQKAQYEKANDAYSKDKRVIHAYNMTLSLTLMIVSVGLFLAVFISEFLVPLFLKNGQTLGKKIFSIAVMRIDGVKITGPQLFIRSILGKYTIETMVPVLMFTMLFFNLIGFAGFIVIGGMAILDISLILFTKAHTSIHDLLSSTVVVDYQTQMIFDTKEQMIHYKEEAALKKAEETPYF